MYLESKNHGQPAPSPSSAADPEAPARRVAIGSLIRRSCDLSADQVDQVAAYQKQHQLRFGEAAVALGLVSEDDVAHAWSQQFRYAYARRGGTDHHRELVCALRPFSAQAEAYRGIRAQLKLRLRQPGKQRRAVAVMSAEGGEGKSTFAANIAIAFSQVGGRTLLIDADLRQARQHELFSIPHDTGLADVLAGHTESHLIHAVPALPSLFVLPVGTVPPNPLELLEGSGFEALLQDVLKKFDHVVVDTAAFSQGMDAPVVADACGLGLIVVRRGRSHLAAAQDLLAVLAQGRTEVAGVVMNEF